MSRRRSSRTWSALASFEDFCTVTASVRGAIAVEVEVFDSEGSKLK